MPLHNPQPLRLTLHNVPHLTLNRPLPRLPPQHLPRPHRPTSRIRPQHVGNPVMFARQLLRRRSRNLVRRNVALPMRFGGHEPAELAPSMLAILGKVIRVRAPGRLPAAGSSRFDKQKKDGAEIANVHVVPAAFPRPDAHPAFAFQRPFGELRQLRAPGIVRPAPLAVNRTGRDDGGFDAVPDGGVPDGFFGGTVRGGVGEGFDLCQTVPVVVEGGARFAKGAGGDVGLDEDAGAGGVDEVARFGGRVGCQAFDDGLGCGDVVGIGTF